MAERDIWVWIRVPVRLIESWIGSLKEMAMRKHRQAGEADTVREEATLREQADRDDADAEILKKALRGEEKPLMQVPDDTQ